MDLDSTRVPAGSFGFLRSCLVDGDPEQHHREQEVRRRAILLSIGLQSFGVAALLIIPLLGNGERLALRIVDPPTPFRLGSTHPNTGASPAIQAHPTTPCLFCKHNENTAPTISTTGHTQDPTPGEPAGFGDGPVGDPNGVLNGALDQAHSAPTPPETHEAIEQKTRRLIVGSIDPARLTRRVEPIYPHLGVQLRRETRVELEAIIATDGSIQSLRVLSGDPLFYQSALDAVRQWRYSPTILDGHPVEVDTHITVIYSLNR